MKRVVFIRHGLTMGNSKQKYIGSTDEGLCNEGINEALRLRDYYESKAGRFHYPLGNLFVSPKKRCTETADIVFTDAPKETVNDLRECDFGLFEGKNYIDLADEPLYKKWVEEECMTQIPGGENPKDFIERSVKAFEECMDRTKDKACFVVHGGTIRAIVSALSEEKIDFYDVKIPQAKELVYDYDGRFLKRVRESNGFYQNRECRYFPCHETDDTDNFNCFFCFCPLFHKNDCGGNPLILENGVKSCENCMRPHKADSWEDIIKNL